MLGRRRRKGGKERAREGEGMSKREGVSDQESVCNTRTHTPIHTYGGRRRPQRLQTKTGAHRLASRVLFAALGHQRGVIRYRSVPLPRMHISVCVLPLLTARFHHTLQRPPHAFEAFRLLLLLQFCSPYRYDRGIRVLIRVGSH
jgi:hypothetical protein